MVSKGDGYGSSGQRTWGLGTRLWFLPSFRRVAVFVVSVLCAVQKCTAMVLIPAAEY